MILFRLKKKHTVGQNKEANRHIEYTTVSYVHFGTIVEGTKRNKHLFANQ